LCLVALDEQTGYFTNRSLAKPMTITRFQDLPPDRLVAFCELTHQMDAWISGTDAAEMALGSIERLLGATYCSIQFVRDTQSSPLTLRRRRQGLAEDDARKIDRVVVGWVITHDEVLQSDNLAGDERFPYFDSLPAAAISVLAVPVVDQAQTIAVVVAARDLTAPMADDDRFLAVTACRLLASVLKRERQLHLLTIDNDRLRSEVSQQKGFEGLIGQSEAWRHVCDMIRTVAPADVDILLLGESGVGKELCARALHNLSERRHKPFVSVNCGALTESLAESELFGHERGAFTGATHPTHGLFEAAEGGTLLLDEIGAAPLAIQSALLRAIQEREIRPVGATDTRPVDIRIVCSTSADLESMIAAGSFRQDLYHRINVVTVTIPPLRDRQEDIPILAQEFLSRAGRLAGRTAMTISPEVISILLGYDWPGNARELKNAMSHAALFTPTVNDCVDVSALPAHLLNAAGIDPSVTAAASGLDDLLERHEQGLIRKTLEECRWNQSRAARRLNVPEKRIRDRMKKYGITGPANASNEHS